MFQTVQEQFRSHIRVAFRCRNLWVHETIAIDPNSTQL